MQIEQHSWDYVNGMTGTIIHYYSRQEVCRQIAKTNFCWYEHLSSLISCHFLFFYHIYSTRFHMKSFRPLILPHSFLLSPYFSLPSISFFSDYLWCEPRFLLLLRTYVPHFFSNRISYHIHKVCSIFNHSIHSFSLHLPFLFLPSFSFRPQTHVGPVQLLIATDTSLWYRSRILHNHGILSLHDTYISIRNFILFPVIYRNSSETVRKRTNRTISRCDLE